MGDISELGLGIGEIRRGATHRVADFWRMFFSLKNYDYRYMCMLFMSSNSTFKNILCGISIFIYC